ncbi:MAG: phnA protein [Spirochaetae bacterium HGW-Spirochaetae-1]|jgi:protein PhnA|nr:MAG: phnA protein [Spirochaetae bacterium HGW-Spirochaetae-1]
MAKGLDRHRERMDILASFGRNLARRSGSRCELCSSSGVPLHIYEVSPVADTPDMDRCIFICTTCEKGMENPPGMADHWRCLNTAVWSEIPALQVISVRILRQISPKSDWARSLLEEVYLDPEIEEWIDKQ